MAEPTTQPQVQSTVHGYPRIGPKRELKTALEAYWAGRIPEAELLDRAAGIRRDAWSFLQGSGVDLVPSNDFSLYDHVLDVVALAGAVPPRYGHTGGPVSLDTYFAMARGLQDDVADVTAMEMTKWFDTNYHYIVPELGPETTFGLRGSKPVDEVAEALAQGIPTKPVLVGPASLLLLSKTAPGAPAGFDRLSLLDPLLDVYAEALSQLGGLGVEWVQLDEPCFVQDRTVQELDVLAAAYDRLGTIKGRSRMVVSTYFGHAGDALPVLAGSLIEGIGLDLRRGRADLDWVRSAGGMRDKTLFAGIVDGRNVWIDDLDTSLALLEELRSLTRGLVVSTSCSLLHVPIDLDAETRLDPELRSWMAFARQKVREVVTLTKALNGDDVTKEIVSHRRALADRCSSSRTVDPAVRQRIASLAEADTRRRSPLADRRTIQRRRLGLPLLPTTTIGSFPQTRELRGARAALAKGTIDDAEYTRQMRDEIRRVVALQEDIGLDVLVHGEPERNDMVQYFAEQLEGYAFTENGWVQSYGSRCTRPPILYGDVSRPRPMTVEWIRYARSLTPKPVKGMLTGPVTMLEWSFVRDDQERRDTCLQLAFAIRDEVADLEREGIEIIQVDEAAFREGLPLRRSQWAEYVRWAVQAFRVATSVVRDETQVHGHMCYSEFGDVIEAIFEMDADVTQIEASRSKMEVVDDWAGTSYAADLGAGVWDVHSPRVPSTAEIADLLRRASAAISSDRLWVCPDCGLKTRGYAEVEPALRHMMEAARQVRDELVPAR